MLFRVTLIVLFCISIILIPLTSHSLDLNDLADTTWSGKDSDGDFWKYEFKGKGHFVLTNGKGDTAEGTWKLGRDDSVTMQVDDEQIVFHGSLNSDQLQGYANADGGQSWSWTALQELSANTDKKVSRQLSLLIPLAFDYKKYSEIETPDEYAAVQCLAFSPDGANILTSTNGSTKVLEINTGNILQGGRSGGYNCKFSPNGNTVASSSYGNSIQIVEFYPVFKEFGLQKTSKINALTYSSDGRYIVYGDEIGNVVFWGINSQSEFLTFNVGGEIKKIAIGQGNSIIAASGDKWTSLWNTSTKEKLSSIQHGGPLAFSYDGKLLAVGNKIFETISNELVYEAQAEEREITSVAFSPNGEYVLFGVKSRWEYTGIGDPGKGDGYLILFNLLTKQAQKITTEPMGALSVAFSPDGNSFAYSTESLKYGEGNYNSENKKVVIWKRPLLVEKYSEIQDVLRDTQKYQDFIRSTQGKLSDLVKERDCLLVNKVNKSQRGEFEKTIEYADRIKKASELEQQIIADYKAKNENMAAKIKTENAEWQKILASSLYSIEFNDISVGNYNPNTESFSVTLLGQSIQIPVPREKAVELSKRKDSLKIDGKIKYYDGFSVELVNAYLVDKTTSNRFAFGNHLEPVMVASTEKTPPQLIITSLTIFEPSGNGMLDAGEKGKIRVVLKNNSKGTAFGVNAKFEPASSLPVGVALEGQKYLGVINGGEEKVIEADITASEDIAAADIQIKALAAETNGFDAKPVMLAFKSKALVPPVLQIASIDIKSSDGKRVLSKGVQADLAVRVQNEGSGVARGVAVALNTNSKDIVTYGTDSIKVGSLAPGESKEVVFSIAVNQRYQGGNTLPVSFVVKEERPRFTVKPDITLALNEEVSDIRVVKVEARDTEPAKVVVIDDISVVPVLNASKKAFGDNDVALVVGIERYQNFSEAKFAVNDARLVEKYLMALGIPRRNIQLVTDEKATKGGIEKSLENWLPNQVNRNSRVFVYYSGHGTPDPVGGEPYIFPHDGDPSYLTSTSYSLKRLYTSLARLNAKEVIVVVDSCFSGSGERSVLAMGARPAIVKIDDPVLNSDKMAVLTSTEGTQISTSMQDKKHGVFTYYFLKSIKDGKKNLGEIYTDIKPKIEDEAKRLNVNQSPVLKPGVAMVSGKYSMQQ